MISWWAIPLAVLGFINAGYIWWKRSRKEEMKCLIGNGGCNAVVNSRYNTLFGVGNEVMGMVFYAGVTGAVLFMNLVMESIQGISLVLVLFIVESAALLVSATLTIIQAFVLRQWCEYCVLSTVINAFIWALTFFAVPKFIS